MKYIAIDWETVTNWEKEENKNYSYEQNKYSTPIGFI